MTELRCTVGASGPAKRSPRYRDDKLDTAKADAVAIPTEYLKHIRSELAYCGYLLRPCP